MKIESVQDAALSNAEVLKHLDAEWQQRATRVRTIQVPTAEAKSDGKSKKDKSKDKANDKTSDEPKKRKENEAPPNYALVSGDIHAYFKNSRKAEALPEYGNYPEGSVRVLLQKLKKFNLTKAELVMILNLKPRDTVVLDIIIEELDNRIEEGDRQEELLSIINEVLGNGENGGGVGEDDEEDGGDAMEDEPAAASETVEADK